ncbi:MAG: hypothetical protein WCF95_06145 [bacterium]
MLHGHGPTKYNDSSKASGYNKAMNSSKGCNATDSKGKYVLPGELPPGKITCSDAYSNFFGYDLNTEHTNTDTFTTTTKPVYEPNPIPDQTYENLYNAKGGVILDSEQINGQPAKTNSAVDTFLGFLSDGVMGKGSKFVINTKNCDIKKEFIEQIDGDDTNKTISYDEFKKKMENLETQRNSGYYGDDLVQYSEKKVKASFEAMDADNNGEIDSTDLETFFNEKRLKEDKTPFPRDKNGTMVNYENTASIAFTDLPEEIQDETTTMGEPILVTPGSSKEETKTTTTSTARVDFGGLKTNEWRRLEDGSYTEIKINQRAKDLEKVIADQQNSYPNGVPLAKVIEDLKQKGYSEKEARALIKESLDNETGHNPETHKLNDEMRFQMNPNALRKFQEKEKLKDLVLKSQDNNPNITWGEICSSVKDAKIYRPGEYQYNITTLGELIQKDLGFDEVEIKALGINDEPNKKPFAQSAMLKAEIEQAKLAEQERKDKAEQERQNNESYRDTK